MLCVVMVDSSWYMNGLCKTDTKKCASKFLAIQLGRVLLSEVVKGVASAFGFDWKRATVALCSPNRPVPQATEHQLRPPSPMSTPPVDTTNHPFITVSQPPTLTGLPCEHTS